MADSSLDWIDGELARLEAAHLRRRLTCRESAQRSVRVRVAGRDYLNFSSNDYLGLAADGGALARQVASEMGWGSGASPLITGRGAWHARLETALAEFEGTEAALLFSSGYATNVGVIAALAGPRDLIVSDAKNHASIIDGCRLSRARVRTYPHADVDAAERLLRDSTGRRRLIVTDGLFSMDGDVAPLRELVAVAERHHAMLLVDEAHATGVLGPRGRGSCELLGVEDAVPIRIGTLSKALGGMGGFVSGSQRLIDYLSNRARTYFFSTAPPEPLAAVACAALDRVTAQPHRRRELLERAEQLRQRLRADGWRTGTGVSQIVPIYVGTPQWAMQLTAALKQRGVLVPAIRPPSVPAGESLLRISLTADHNPEMLEQLRAALRSARDAVPAPS